VDDTRIRLEGELEQAGRRGELERGARVLARLLAEGYWHPADEVRSLADDCPEFLPGLWRCLLERSGAWAELAPRRRELAARVCRRALAGEQKRPALAQSRAWFIVRMATAALRLQRAAWLGPGGRVDAIFVRELDGWRGSAFPEGVGRPGPAERCSLGRARSARDRDRALVVACLLSGVEVEGVPSFADALVELQARTGATPGSPMLRPRRPRDPCELAPAHAAAVRETQRRIAGALEIDEPRNAGSR